MGWVCCGKGLVLTPQAFFHQATEQLQTTLRDPGALPALCDLLASATDPQASCLPLLDEILKFLHVPGPAPASAPCGLNLFISSLPVILIWLATSSHPRSASLQRS